MPQPSRNRYYDGPPSDHFDGERFFLPGHHSVRTFGDMLKWQFNSKKTPWPARIEDPAYPPPPRRVEGSGLIVTFIGQATCLIQTGGLNILTDPFFSERASPLAWMGPRRVRAPGIALADLPPIDAVLLSHNHYDHMDLPALAALHNAFRPLIVTPLGNGAILERARRPFTVVERDWGEAHALGDSVRVHLTPALHWSKRTAFDRNHALWAAFVLETPAGSVYFAADTGYGTGAHFRDVRKRFGRPRLALLPIGAYEPRWFMKPQHMNPAEAAAAHQDLGAMASLAIHFGTVQLTDEAIDAPVVALKEAFDERGIAPEDFRVLSFGESWRLGDLAAAGGGVLEDAAE